jgi:hypothetical protein
MQSDKFAITLVLPYANAEKQWRFWADDEAHVDFKHDTAAACRCTAAYAATELAWHLEKCVDSPEIKVASSRPETGCFISLEIVEPDRIEGAYELLPAGQGVAIKGYGRCGLLSGAYEFLRMQGWRWHEPGEKGIVYPPMRATPLLPGEPVKFAPSFTVRALDIFLGPSKESAELLVWMARQGMNCFHNRSLTAKLGQKLGMMVRMGGHLLQKILHPDRVLPSGKTVWEEHPEWFGLLPENATKVDVLMSRCCMSQTSLYDFITDEIIEKMRHDWAEADILDVWGLDNSTAKACECEKCKNLGNTSDQTLHFLSSLRTAFDKALREKRLPHPVKITITAYDGNDSITPPTKPLPENLAGSGDICIFYPIDRCYRHDFNDITCKENQRYFVDFVKWRKNNPGLQFWMGEYYNVSKFEDLPLLFTDRMAADIPLYQEFKADGVTYMHPPLANWNLRAWTQILYAALLRNTETDVGVLLEEYLANHYGTYACAMKTVYAEVEKAWRDISQWRNWHGDNILRNLMLWDGAAPEQEFPLRHFANEAEAIAAGQESLTLLLNALKTVSKQLAQATIDEAEKATPPGYQPETPEEVAKMRECGIYEYRLSEDRKGLIYGADTMELMVSLLEYHNSLLHKDKAAAAKAWKIIERVADKMDSYYVPVKFDQPGPGVKCLDALTRSQLRLTVSLCRKNL